MAAPLRRADQIRAAMSGATPCRAKDELSIETSDLERAVLEIAVEILGDEHLEPSDRYGEVGGDSINAVRILSRCWREYSVELPLRSLGPDTTFGELAVAIGEAASKAAKADDRMPAVTKEDNDVFRVSPHQEALYYLYQASPNQPIYNVPVAMTLTGRLDVQRLQNSVGRLMARHESLRCTFAPGEDGRPIMVVNPADADVVDGLLPVTDLSDVPLNQQEEAIQRAVTAAAAEPFDLRQAPFRARLIRVGEDEHRLVVAAHHIVCDGWSLDLLIQDLLHFYTETPTTSPARGVRDLAAWERGRLATERREELADHWRHALSEAPDLLDLPVDRARSATRSYRGQRAVLEISPELTDGLRRRATRCGATLFTVLAAGLSTVLRRYSGQQEMLIGFPVARRQAPEAQNIVMNMSNTVPLRVSHVGDPTVNELLGQIHEALVTAQDHADLPFDKIVEAVSPARTPSHNPLFQVALVVPAARKDLPVIPGLRVERDDPFTETSKFDLSWFMEESSGGLRGYVEFSIDLFDLDTVERLRGHFMNVLQGLTEAQSDERTSSLLMQTPAERQKLIDEFLP